MAIVFCYSGSTVLKTKKAKMLFYNYRIVWVPELPVILHFFPIESMLTDVFHSLAAAFLYHVKILTHAIKTELLFLIPRGLNV